MNSKHWHLHEIKGDNSLENIWSNALHLQLRNICSDRFSFKRLLLAEASRAVSIFMNHSLTLVRRTHIIQSCLGIDMQPNDVYCSSRQAHDGGYVFHSRFISGLLSWVTHTMTGMHTSLRTLCQRLVSKSWCSANSWHVLTDCECGVWGLQLQ